MLILSCIQIICMIIYLIKGFTKIQLHSFYLFESFKKFSANNLNNDFNPPKKIINTQNENNEKISSSKNGLKNDIILFNIKNKKEIKKIKIKNKKVIKINNTSTTQTYMPFHQTKLGTKNELIDPEKKIIKSFKNFDKFDIKIKIVNEEMYMNIINDFVNPEFDENDFDDVIQKDKRTFCEFFTEKMINNQMFINTFYNKDMFKPRILKIMLLVMTIELYFVITALFYTEDYLSERFNSDEKENFFSFIPKRINAFIYTSIVNGIIGYFLTYFFDHEDFLRRIFTLISFQI